MLYWIIAVGVPLAGLVFFARLKAAKGGGRGAGSQAYDPKTGLGRGAPGFTTNVKRIAVPPEIIARIRAGEEVSAEEITRAQEKMQRDADRAAAKEAAEAERIQRKQQKRKEGKR